MPFRISNLSFKGTKHDSCSSDVSSDDADVGKKKRKVLSLKSLLSRNKWVSNIRRASSKLSVDLPSGSSSRSHLSCSCGEIINSFTINEDPTTTRPGHKSAPGRPISSAHLPLYGDTECQSFDKIMEGVVHRFARIPFKTFSSDCDEEQTARYSPLNQHNDAELAVIMDSFTAVSADTSSCAVQRTPLDKIIIEEEYECPPIKFVQRHSAEGALFSETTSLFHSQEDTNSEFAIYKQPCDAKASNLHVLKPRLSQITPTNQHTEERSRAANVDVAVASLARLNIVDNATGRASSSTSSANTLSESPAQPSTDSQITPTNNSGEVRHFYSFSPLYDKTKCTDSHRGERTTSISKETQQKLPHSEQHTLLSTSISPPPPIPSTLTTSTTVLDEAKPTQITFRPTPTGKVVLSHHPSSPFAKPLPKTRAHVKSFKVEAFQKCSSCSPSLETVTKNIIQAGDPATNVTELKTTISNSALRQTGSLAVNLCERSNWLPKGLPEISLQSNDANDIHPTYEEAWDLKMKRFGLDIITTKPSRPLPQVLGRAERSQVKLITSTVPTIPPHQSKPLSSYRSTCQTVKESGGVFARPISQDNSCAYNEPWQGNKEPHNCGGNVETSCSKFPTHSSSSKSAKPPHETAVAEKVHHSVSSPSLTVSSQEDEERSRKGRFSSGNTGEGATTDTDSLSNDSCEEAFAVRHNRALSELTSPRLVDSPASSAFSRQLSLTPHQVSTHACQPTPKSHPNDTVDPNIPLDEQLWYYSQLSRLDAEHMLQEACEGSFLVRKSETSKTDYSLSIKHKNSLLHMKICRVGDGYVLGGYGQSRPSIPHMLHHYSLTTVPVRGAESVMLKWPVCR